jgi:hypothetical protein
MGKPVRYLCQDEMRVGLMSQRGRVITSRGVKPIAMEQYVRENFWLYGVVEPLSGWHLCQEYPHLNGMHFQRFLDAVSKALGDELAVMQMDQAQAHRAKALIWPENLIPIFQPPYSPELNPAERFWQHLKSPLKGQCFETLDQLRRQLWDRIESLSAEAIASLTGYDFILEALFCAAL